MIATKKAPGERQAPKDVGTCPAEGRLLKLPERNGEPSALTEFGGDTEGICRMLAAFVPLSGYVAPVGRAVRILNVGCGLFLEARALAEYFGGGFCPEMVGIDINPSTVRTARETLERREPILSKATGMVVGDATELVLYPQIPDKVDVVMLRHHQIIEDSEKWTAIFEQSLGRLSEEGIMILTSFTDIENEMVLGTLGRLKCEVVVSERNRDSTPFMMGLHFDGYVTIAKRR